MVILTLFGFQIVGVNSSIDSDTSMVVPSDQRPWGPLFPPATPKVLKSSLELWEVICWAEAFGTERISRASAMACARIPQMCLRHEEETKGKGDEASPSPPSKQSDKPADF